MRIFDRMADFLKVKSSQQCRSHHQKVIAKMEDIKTIIHTYKQLIGKDRYRLLYKRYKSGQSITNEEEFKLERPHSVITHSIK
jgi:hypothetical protein